MNIRFLLAIVVTPLLFCCGQVSAKDQTVEEFQAYASRRMANVNEEQMVAYVKLVDANADGEISDDEFANRIDAYQQVFKSVQPKPGSHGHGLPENWLTDFEKARAVSIESGKPVVAMFSASWCGPCKKMIATVFPTDEAKQALQEFVPVYIDSEKYTELAAENEVRGYPTFICFDVNGTAVEQHVGGGNLQKFAEMLGKFKAAEVADKSK